MGAAGRLMGNYARVLGGRVKGQGYHRATTGGHFLNMKMVSPTRICTHNAALRPLGAAPRYTAGMTSAKQSTASHWGRQTAHLQPCVVLQAAKQISCTALRCAALRCVALLSPLGPTLPVLARLLSLANGSARLCTACLATANACVRHLRGRNTSVSPNSNTERHDAS